MLAGREKCRKLSVANLLAIRVKELSLVLSNHRRDPHGIYLLKPHW